MTSHQESLIEALALNPSFLSPEDFDSVSKLVAENDEAAHLFDYFQSFYQEFSRPQVTFVSDRIRSFMDSLVSRGRMIRLTPRLAKQIDPTSGKSARPRMAAATGVRRKFELIGSSLSVDQETNLRFLKDHDHGMIKVYLVSGDKSVFAHAMVMFANTSVFLVTNDQGYAELDAELFEGLNLIGREVFVRPLTDQLSVNVLDLSAELSRIPYASDLRVEASFADGNLSIHASGEGYWLLGKLEGEQEWRLVHLGETLVIPQTDVANLNLRIYG